MTKDNLKLHLKHTAVDKKWSNRLKLSNERHIINHKIYCENIQNISCTACIAHCALKKFISSPRDMSRHHIAIEAVNLKQRNFKCLLQSLHRRHHLNSSHGDGSTFSHCPFCKNTFTTSRRVLEHTAKFHEEQIQGSKENWYQNSMPDARRLGLRRTSAGGSSLRTH